MITAEGEEWRVIEGFEDYRVSSHGNVVNVERPNTYRKLNLNHRGFPTLVLFKKEHGGSRYVRQVNKLVADAFLEPADPSANSIWHIDGDLTNCHVDNLRWDMRARVLEWNDMHIKGQARMRTPRVMDNESGVVFNNAFECGLAMGEIESAVVAHIERYPEQYAHRARFRYVDG